MEKQHKGRRDRWTAERVEILRAGWTEGLSAEQIARRLPEEFTRNAVIGKAHRLGLEDRGSPIRPRGSGAHPLSVRELARRRDRALAQRREKQRGDSPVVAPVVPPESLPVVPAKPRLPEPTALLTLEQTQERRGCLWPHGHRPNMLFCGKNRSPHDVSYCPEHHQRAWKMAGAV